MIPLLFVTLILISCNDQPTSYDVGGNSITLGYTPETIYTNKAHQSFVVLSYDNVKKWLDSNSNAKIVSIACIGRSGSDAYFILIFEPSDQVPEKSAKEIALEKLSPVDKEALGIK
jgi:hypothetical protein